LPKSPISLRAMPPLTVAKYVSALQQWVDEVIQGQRWEQYADLHLDVLDAQFRRPGRWVEASLLLLKVLEQMVARRNYQLLLVIRLATTPVSAAGRTLERHTLEGMVGNTPPSFYLFPQPSEVVTQTVQASMLLPGLSQQLQRQVYLQEQHEQGAYTPSLLVISTTV
jgi:hypothetical protein